MGTAELTSAAFWQSDASHGLSPDAPLDVAPHGHLLVKTSGTEGTAKWCALGKLTFLVNAEAVNQHLESTSADRWLIALPTTHVGGFAIYARACLSEAAVVHLDGKWDATRFAQVCRDELITLTSLVPTQVFDLVQQQLAAPDSLRAIVVGGGGLAKDIGQRARDLGWPVLQSFGMTETASQIATEPLEHLRTGFDPDMLEVLRNWRLQTDAEGTLTVGGLALASGFVEAGEWKPIGRPLVTRDRVHLWQEGSRQFLRFLGRDSQMLKILGELVALPPLQAKLDALALGRAGRCVLVPVDDARRGTALVLVSTDLIAAPLVEQFNAEVQPFERIERFVQLERLPLTDLGKVRLADLAAQITR
jgi:O-succinylbenzoic acid--CoA ligase